MITVIFASENYLTRFSCYVIGAYNCAIGIYSTMAIKNVQHDTMSHFITDRATTFGLFNEALTQLYGAHEIYHSNEAEVNLGVDHALFAVLFLAWRISTKTFCHLCFVLTFFRP